MTRFGMLKRCSAACVLLAGLVCSFSVNAQAGGIWPVRPVRLVVAFAPAGTVDLISRLLADRLSPMLGQPFVVENRPGAGGNLATEQVARGVSDGYTYVVGGSPTHSVNPHLLKKLGYDPIADMTSIALVGTAPNILVVNPALPVHTVNDLVALARSKPGQLSFSSAGSGTSGHLAGELFSKQANLETLHVPYKGQADAITGVVRGDVAFAFVTVAGTLAQVKAGRLRAIAITSAARSPLAPDVPTVVQSGYPDFEVLAWYSISGPKDIPGDVVRRFVQALDQIMKDPATGEKFIALGTEPTYLTGDRLVEYMKQDSAKWGRVIREAKITSN